MSLNVSPLMAEVMAAAGFDFLLIDLEHTAVSLETAAGLMAVATGRGVTPLVRLPADGFELIQRAMDSGSQGIFMPHVDRREQAERIQHFAMYPPRGHRGYLSRGPHTGFRRVEDPNWLQNANTECLIMMMVESQQSIRNLEAILEVGIIDAVVMGPGDLSVSFGKPGQFACPEVIEATHHVITTCRQHGVASGTAVGTMDDAVKWARAGAQVLIVSTDLYFLLDATTTFVRGIHDRIPELVEREDARGYQS